MAEYVVAQLTAEDWKKVELRDILLFGTYPKEENGEPLPIEWEVIDKKDGKFFLLSVYGLDVKQFDDRWIDEFSSDERITWVDSPLRAWINNEFCHTAFLPEERHLIAPKKLSEGEEDKVSLLSYSEASKYIESHRGHHKSAQLTPLADDKIHAEHYSQRKFGWRWDRGWWLSSMSDKTKAACVAYSWQLESITENYCSDYQAVRPAIWLDPNGNYGEL